MDESTTRKPDEGKGRVDDVGTRTTFHSETGKGTTSKVVHFRFDRTRWQIRASVYQRSA